MIYLSYKKGVRIRVQSIMNEDICFEITVPEDCVDKVKELAPKCGETWYNEECDYFAEPLCKELGTQGIPYILHDDYVDEPDDWAEFC